MSATASPPLQTYRGNCHCGAFIYEVELPQNLIEHRAVECNCSICRKKGYLGLLPGPGDAFRVVRGSEDDLTVYTFGPGGVHHKFCPTCGTPLLARRLGDIPPGQDLGVNAHSLQDVDTWELGTIPVDGNSVGPAYQVPQYTGPEPSSTGVPEGKETTTYHGSCHCGAVTLALKSAPLDKTYPGTAKICNCSICERNAYIWIYPGKEQVSIQGSENLVRYSFGHRIVAKTFCRICGVHVSNEPVDMSEGEYGALSDELKGWVDFSRRTGMMNLRVLNGFDLNEIDLKTERTTAGREAGGRYANP